MRTMQTRVNELEKTIGTDDFRATMAFCHEGEDENEVWEKHFQKHPEDRDAPLKLLITFVKPKEQQP